MPSEITIAPRGSLIKCTQTWKRIFAAITANHLVLSIGLYRSGSTVPHLHTGLTAKFQIGPYLANLCSSHSSSGTNIFLPLDPSRDALLFCFLQVCEVAIVLLLVVLRLLLLLLRSPFTLHTSKFYSGAPTSTSTFSRSTSASNSFRFSSACPCITAFIKQLTHLQLIGIFHFPQTSKSSSDQQSCLTGMNLVTLTCVFSSSNLANDF